MSEPDSDHNYALVRLQITGSARATYSLEEAAGLAGLHPEVLRHYCQLGLLGEEWAKPGAELVFDDDAVYELRRFEHYRRNRGVDRRTLRLICGLWREIDRLRAEIRFLRR